MAVLRLIRSQDDYSDYVFICEEISNHCNRRVLVSSFENGGQDRLIATVESLRVENETRNSVKRI
jgi:hypothetical protein